MNTIRNRLPVRFRCQIREEDFEGLEEIRIRTGRPLELYYGNYSRTRFMERAGRSDIVEMLNYLTGYSPYAYEEEIKKGFFTIEGGHRVGIVGHTSMAASGEQGSIADIPEITGINIRIARQVRNCGLPLMPYIRSDNTVHNTIFLAPPGVGKTTVLRDVIRILSDGADGGRPFKIGVVDERSEIAACQLGIPQNDVGMRTDVMDNCPKQLGMEMLVRSMSPQIIAVDELGGADATAVEQILYSGCRLLGTVHGASFEELHAKQGLRHLLEEGWITRVFLLERKNGERCFRVYDESGRSAGEMGSVGIC